MKVDARPALRRRALAPLAHRAMARPRRTAEPLVTQGIGTSSCAPLRQPISIPPKASTIRST